MFGYAWRITEEFPQYFLDCRQVFSDRRWDNRVTSASGDWSGNVFAFWYKAYPLLSEGLPVPFELGSGMTRIDDTPQHKAVREALTNMLVHADYYGRAGLVALRTNEGIELSNPGVLRLPVSVIEGGGVSDPRNLTLLTMFNLVGKGDKAGSGFDVLRRSARYAGVDDPVLTESYDPDRVALILRLATGGRSLGIGEDRRRSAKTGEDFGYTMSREDTVMAYVREHGAASASELSAVLGLGASRTREVLSGMVARGELVRTGKTSATRYCLPGM